MWHLQIHLNDDISIEHIYFDYNLGSGETRLDCAKLITSKNGEGHVNIEKNNYPD
jgi:hypothetical protein